MRYSEVVAMLAADLEAKGDTENVTLGLTVTGTDGKKYRLDAVIAAPGDIEVLRDSNFVNGMACVVADYKGPHEVFV